MARQQTKILTFNKLFFFCKARCHFLTPPENQEEETREKAGDLPLSISSFAVTMRELLNVIGRSP
jgi:hypothetical protein